jgi:hypothetical protein
VNNGLVNAWRGKAILNGKESKSVENHVKNGFFGANFGE